MAKLLFQGHGSARVTAGDGTVVYVDPYAGQGYGPPADLVLITHDHHDHNEPSLVTQKPGCTLITARDALGGGEHQEFLVRGIHVRAVQAQNKNHSVDSCVGYVLTVDGVRIYFAGDTSETMHMKTILPALSLDYALYPIDGVYNMGPEEAARCALMVGARHDIPIHMKPGALFDMERARMFLSPNRLIMEPDQEITL